MSWETAKKTLDFFLPRLGKNYRLAFLGGEPFLAFDLIKEAVAYLKIKNKELSKTVHYAANSNGSLLDDAVLDFLQQNNFTLAVSFDAFKQDWGRKKNSFNLVQAAVKKALARPGIRLEIASTFTPGTVAGLCESLEYIIGLGVPKASFSLDMTVAWDRASLDRLARELASLRKFLLKNYPDGKKTPVRFFSEGEWSGIWQCAAGLTQLLVTPTGQIWGCPLFYEFFKGKESSPAYGEYCFGGLPDFVNTYRRVPANYARFRMDNFHRSNSPCFLCPLVEKCIICPVSRPEGDAPRLLVASYLCEMSKILIAEKEKFARGTGTL